MSGHSKWSTIKRKKEKTDNARAKVFTKIGREIAVAVKAGGADPAGNSKLKDVIAKAKAANMPNDNIERVIKKAAGEGSGENYDEIVYEGYGPSGIAIIVETLTDNRNRTAADVRHYFDKFGGNMGQSGCVSFMFSRQGVILFEKEGIDEDQLMEDALEAGAVDFIAEDEIWVLFVTTLRQRATNSFLLRLNMCQAHTQLSQTRTISRIWAECLKCSKKMMTFRMYITTGKTKKTMNNCSNLACFHFCVVDLHS